MSVVGVLECVAGGWVSGWATRPLDGPIELICRLNGVEVLRACADRERPQRPGGVGCVAGFLWHIPAQYWHEGVENWVEVLVARTGQFLQASPYRVDAGACVGQIGAIRQLHLSGWAVLQAPSEAVLTLNLWVDDLPVVQTHAALLRPDLAALGLAEHPVGIRVMLPEEAMDGLAHRISLRVIGTQQVLRGDPLLYQATPAEIQEWRWRSELVRIQAIEDDGEELAALAALADLGTRFPQAGQPFLRAGELAQTLGLLAQALTWFDAVVPGQHRGHALAGKVAVLLVLNRQEQAKQACQALAASGADPAIKQWASVQCLAVKDRTAAITALHAAVVQEERPNWRAKLLHWGLGQDLVLPLTQLNTSLDSSGAWELTLAQAGCLLRQGQRQQARFKATASAEAARMAAADAELLLRAAEFWLDAAQPRQGLVWLERALVCTLASSRVQTKILRKLMGACHEFGCSQWRDQLFKHYLAHTDSVDVSLVVEYAALLIRDGEHIRSQACVNEIERQRGCALPVAWQARLAREYAQHTDVLGLLAERVRAQNVSLADTRVWLHTLIDLEQIDDAQAELERLASCYAEREMISLRVQLLRQNLEFESALELLQKSVRQYGSHKSLVIQLADMLITCGQEQEAHSWIEQGLTYQAGDWSWGLLRLRHVQEFGTHWAEWFATADELKKQINFRARLHLMQLQVQKLTLTAQFGRAERLLSCYTRDMAQRWPMSADERTTQLLSCANLWQTLNRLDHSKNLLAQVQTRPHSVHHQMVWYRIAASVEAYSGRNSLQIKDWFSNIPYTRHHLHLLPSLDLVGLTPQKNNQRIAILFHLYYTDLWEEFWPELQSLQGTNFKLFVTTGEEGVPELIRQAMQMLDAQVQIRQVENWGFDVGGHWQSLDHIDLSQFDLVLLLQSKKSKHVRTGSLWRANLRQALIGSPRIWRTNLAAFAADPQLGMVGSALHRGSFDSWQYLAMREVLQALGMPTRFDAIKNIYEYVGGTMFLMRADLLADMHRLTRHRLVFKSYEQLSIGHRLDYSLGHAMERAFGLYTRWRGFRVGWR